MRKRLIVPRVVLSAFVILGCAPVHAVDHRGANVLACVEEPVSVVDARAACYEKLDVPRVCGGGMDGLAPVGEKVLSRRASLRDKLRRGRRFSRR